MLRSKELEFLNENILRKKSTLILGRKGSGKTWMLSHLKGIYVEYPGMKLILEAIVKKFDLYTERAPRYMNTAELLDAVRPKLKKTVLLLDEFDDARRPVIRLIEKLAGEGATVIAASERKPWTSCFRDTIKLLPLNRKESEALACATFGADDFALDIIVTKSLGYPGKIIELCKAYEIALKNWDVEPENRNSIVTFFNELKPEFPEKTDILPFEYLFVIGFGLLIIKFFFWDKGNFKMGYVLGGLGYLTLILWRTLFYKKSSLRKRI